MYLHYSTISLLGDLPLSISLGIWEFSVMDTGPFTWKVIASVLFLGFIATELAMVLWNKAFIILDANVVSLTFFAQPVVGSILGIVLLNESITPLFIFGGFLISLGLVIANRELRRKPPPSLLNNLH